MKRIRVFNAEIKSCGRRGCTRAGMFTPVAEIRPIPSLPAVDVFMAISPVCDIHRVELERDLRADESFLKCAAGIIRENGWRDPFDRRMLGFRWGHDSWFPSMS